MSQYEVVLQFAQTTFFKDEDWENERQKELMIYHRLLKITVRYTVEKL